MLSPNQREGREQVGDDGGAPEAHLAPGKHVAHEAGRHHQQVDDDAEDPQHFARRLVRAVVQSAEHVDVDRDEEHRGAGGVHVAQQPAVVDVADDALDRLERQIGVSACSASPGPRRSGSAAQHHRQDGAERPPVVQVARRRIGHERGMHEAHDREAPLQPLQGGSVADIDGPLMLRSCRTMRRRARGLGLASALNRSEFWCRKRIVRRDGQVQRRGSLTDTARAVVQRTVAGTEETVVQALMGDRDAAEMGADAGHDQPLLMAGLGPRLSRSPDR